MIQIKKRLLFLMILISGMLILSACGIPKPPDKNEIADTLPEDILSYTLDGNYSILNVKKVEIDKRQTNDKQDIVYAVIKLEDDYITKTVYDVLYCTKPLARRLALST